MALHRELLKRRPGSYPRRWLAARLGVSARTLFSYNQRLDVHSRPGFLVTVINWQTIERLPLDEPLQGAYLITLQGKKYPALRQIASHLLARGESLSLKQQTVNYYWYGEVEPAPVAWVPPACPPPQAAPAVIQPALPAPPPAQSHWSALPPPLASPPADIRPKQATIVSDYKKPLESSDQEALARQLYDLLNHMGGSEFKKLNRASARRLVVTYEPPLIRDALYILKRREASGTLRNPVGFFITLLRSTSRASQNRGSI